MKRNTYTVIFVLMLAAVPFSGRADDSHQNMVMEHGAQVMPRRAVKLAHPGALQNRTLPGGHLEIAHLM